jgi:hypothetical protein
MIASNNSNTTALLACRQEIYYDIHLQAGQCGLPAENMHAQLGLCITGYGATSMSHARYTTHIKTTSAQLHGAGWSPHQFAVPPFLLQAGHCGLPVENLHAQPGFCNRVWCNQQVSCKVHHPHQHNFSPAPWSWVEPRLEPPICLTCETPGRPWEPAVWVAPKPGRRAHPDHIGGSGLPTSSSMHCLF